MLWQRIITASVLVPIAILAIVYLPDRYFALTIALLLSLVAWEWSKLAGITAIKQRLVYLGIFWITLALAAIIPPIFILTFSAIIWLSSLYFVSRYPHINKKIFTGWRGCGLSLLILIPCWVGFNALHADGIKYIFAVLLIVWSADTGAYFIGKSFGRHKLAPEVSPKKTIEGLVGGLLLTLFAYNLCLLYSMSSWIELLAAIGWEILIVCCLYLLLVFGKNILFLFDKNKLLPRRLRFKKYLKLSFWELVFVIIIAIIYCLVWKIGLEDWHLLLNTMLAITIVVLFAALGDLLESVIKRIANVKDSGTCIPGHGGIFDRLDSLLAAVPIFALEMTFIDLFFY